MPSGNVPTVYSREESEIIQHAYERYDSDSRVHGPHDYEAFSDAVAFAVRGNAVKRKPSGFDIGYRAATNRWPDEGHGGERDDDADKKSSPENEKLVRALKMEKEKAMYAAKEDSAFNMRIEDFQLRAASLLKTVEEITKRRWEYELSSAEAWYSETGEHLRIEGHSATIRVPGGPEVTVLASCPAAALKAALRGAIAALARQPIDEHVA